MSLSEAVLSVADEMEKLANDRSEVMSETILRSFMRSFAREIRTAVKASGNDNQKGQQNLISPQLQHVKMIEEARKEFRKDGAKRLTDFEERTDPKFVQVVGGSSDGVLVPVDPTMPINARTCVGGEVYELRDDGMLHSV